MATPPQLPHPEPAKKTNPLIWILAAVGGLFALVIIAVVAGGLFIAKKASDMAASPGLTAIKLMVAANPDVELVSSDEAKSTVTIREKKTGKLVTVSFDQIKDGKMTFEQDGEKISIEASKKGDAVEVKSAEGTVRVGESGKLPDWLPAYPGATAEAAGTQASSPTEETGMALFTTTDEPKKILEFYEAALKKAGIKVTSNTTTTSDGALAGMLTGQSADERRSAQVLFGANEGKTSATITYSSKK
jgi:hypothetical protein